jgi:hypothetical protein
MDDRQFDAKVERAINRAAITGDGSGRRGTPPGPREAVAPERILELLSARLEDAIAGLGEESSAARAAIHSDLRSFSASQRHRLDEELRELKERIDKWLAEHEAALANRLEQRAREIERDLKRAVAEAERARAQTFDAWLDDQAARLAEGVEMGMREVARHLTSHINARGKALREHLGERAEQRVEAEAARRGQALRRGDGADLIR